MEDIQRVFDELNAPSASKLLAALRAEGLKADRREVNAFVARQSVRQVQAPRYKFDGKIAADGINDRWFCDLIDFTAAPTDGGRSVGLHPDTLDSRTFWPARTSSRGSCTRSPCRARRPRRWPPPSTRSWRGLTASPRA